MPRVELLAAQEKVVDNSVLLLFPPNIVAQVSYCVVTFLETTSKKDLFYSGESLLLALDVVLPLHEDESFFCCTERLLLAPYDRINAFELGAE